MKNLKQSLTQPLRIIPKGIILAIVILAVVGFGDATYLTLESYQNKIPPCTIGGCETVLSSQYAKISGIPVSLVGSIFYFTIMVLMVGYYDSKKTIFLKLAAALSVIGALTTLTLIFLMAFVIKALCVYCVVSAVTSLGIFGSFMWMLYINKNNEEIN